MSFEERSYLPFKQYTPLAIEGREHLYGAAENDAFVIRAISDSALNENGIPSGPEGAQAIEQLYAELSNYGIEIAKHAFVVGHMTDGMPGLYIAAERIAGVTLEQKLRHDDGTGYDIAAIEQVFIGLTRYYGTKYQSSGEYLADIRTEQFMYNQSELGTRIMLVDLDPCIGRDERPYLRSGILHRMRCLSFDIATAEHCIGHTLAPARLAFSELVETLSETDRDELASAL